MSETYSPTDFESVEMKAGDRFRIRFDVPKNLSPQSKQAAAQRIELGIINSTQFRHLKSGFNQDGTEYFVDVEVRNPADGTLGVIPQLIIGGVVLIGLIISISIAFNIKSVERITSAGATSLFPLAVIALSVVAIVFNKEIKNIVGGKK